MAIKNVRLVRRVAHSLARVLFAGPSTHFAVRRPLVFWTSSRTATICGKSQSRGEGCGKGEGEQRQSTLSVVLRFLVNEIVCQMKRKASKGNNLNRLNSPSVGNPFPTSDLHPPSSYSFPRPAETEMCRRSRF